jgi:hypothetical protein
MDEFELSLMSEILVHVWICGEFSKLMVVYSFDEAQKCSFC